MTYDANSAYGSGDSNTPGSGYDPGAGYGSSASFGSDLDGATSPDDLSRPLYGATFGQAVRRYWKKFSVFSGRASRSEYWFVALFQALVMLIPGILYGVGAGMVAATASSASYTPYSTPTAEPSAGGMTLLMIGGILLLIIGLVFLVPSLAISWRRLHDANLAGPFWFLTFIPFVGNLIVIVLMILPSKPEGRRFDT